MSNRESGVYRLTVEDVMKCAEDLQRVPKRSEEAQEVYDTLFNYFSQMILNNDFVKVVRCQDCKYRNKYFYCNRLLPWDEDVYVEDDFFCKYGKRRDTNECK